MSKIAIDARELRTTSGRYVERLLHYLQEVDQKNTYTILLTSKDFDGWQPSNPNFSKVVCDHKEFTFDEQIGFLKQIKSLRADLVHFPFVQQPIRYKGKVVTTMQDLTTIRFRNPAKNWLVFTLKREVYKWVNKRVAKKSLLLITPTQFVKDDVVNYCHIDPNKITVTLESADEIPATPEPVKVLEDKQFIMYIGRPSPHKNLPRLIEAFAQLQAKHPNLHLALAGKKDSLYEQIERDVVKRGIKKVVFTDFVSEGQLKWLYEHTAVYTFPSLSEGFGLPALEAMKNAAVPVASSNATCLPEVYKDAALYFDPLDVNDIVEKINTLLSDTKLAKEYAQKGQELVKDYSWERMAKQTLAVYEKALKR
jgi:glycosyltransferase involved in cell wall biosynthesis